MSQSDKKRAARAVYIWLGISAFCALFSAVYEHFSHGVTSMYMVLVFLFPLIGGALPNLLIRLIGRSHAPTENCRCIWNSGVAALAVGSLVRGALEIYGTGSTLVKYYWFIGAVLCCAGIALYAGPKRQKVKEFFTL